jgi:hypothetical protein
MSGVLQLGALSGSAPGDELEVLVARVEQYEEKRWPVEIDGRFDPVDVPCRPILSCAPAD